jgi:hypothetical protein
MPVETATALPRRIPRIRRISNPTPIAVRLTVVQGV